MLENEEWLGEYVLLQNGQMVGPMHRYSRTYWIALNKVEGRRQHHIMADGDNRADYYTVWLSKGALHGEYDIRDYDIVGLAVEWTDERVKELL